MSYVVTAITRNEEAVAVPEGTQVLVSLWGGYVQGTSSETLCVGDILTIERRVGSEEDTYKHDWRVTVATPLLFTGKPLK
jgi:hypothetical protein